MKIFFYGEMSRLGMCGGIGGDDKVPTDDVHNLVKQIQQEVHGKLNATFDIFQAVSFRTQVVAGLNYFIKVYFSFLLKKLIQS